LIIPQLFEEAGASAMDRMLSAVPPGKDQIFLPNHDLVTTGDRAHGPFEHRYFLARRPKLQAMVRVLRKIAWLLGRSPAVEAATQDLVYRLALGRAVPRTLRDPQTGARLPGGYILSYDSQKSMLRAARYREYRPYIHYWKSLQGRRNAWRPKSAGVLHFDIIDAEHLMHKFRQRRGTQEGAQQRFTIRRILADIGTSRPDEQVRKFFRESLSVPDADRRDFLKSRGVIHELPQVAQFFARRRAK
jgi:hypothetical protein